MNIINEMLFGSHLYGLDTPNSDKDYKGIVLPSKNQLLLGKTSFHVDHSTNNNASRNTKDDVDKTYYSLQYFVDLACQGETVALDMLHAPDDKVIVNSDIWKFLVDNRHRFYTKSMKAYIGYVRKQAAKYGAKGSRLAEIERVLNIANAANDNQTVGELTVTESDVVKWVVYKDNYYLEVCGSKYQDNLKIPFLKRDLQKHFDKYGERTKLAKLNEGIDWKALSHALRAGYQARDIFTKGYFEYPLTESSILMDVKQGKLDFNVVEPLLSQLVDEVTILANQSNYPDKVDREFWDDFIIESHLRIFDM
jgi:hypothetical protein